MLKNIVRPAEEVIVEYYLEFLTKDEERTSSYSFPCDKDGNIIESEMNSVSWENYHWCCSHPEEFDFYKNVRKWEHRYRPNAYGTCSCGETVELVDEYIGATECQKCGKWYNLFGNELLPPSMWEE